MEHIVSAPIARIIVHKLKFYFNAVASNQKITDGGGLRTRKNSPCSVDSVHSEGIIIGLQKL